MKDLFFPLLVAAASAIFSPANAQDFSKTDEAARAVPFPKNENIAALSAALTTGLSTEKEKARAIFVWVAENIKYDVKSFELLMDGDAEKAAQRAVPTTVLEREKGVCEGYSALFDTLCRAAGLATIRAAGLTKHQKGRVQPGGHAWNLVRADGEWGLIDVTWGAGDVDMEAGKYRKRFKEQFFFARPDNLVMDHFPTDPLFQVLDCPVGDDYFKKTGLLKPPDCPKAADGFAHLRDSLDAHAALGADEQLLASARRMLRIDPKSDFGNLMMGQYLGKKSQAIFMELARKMSAAQDPDAVRTPQDFDKNAENAAAAIALVEQEIGWLKKVGHGGEAGKRANVQQPMAEQNLKSAQSMLKFNQKMSEMAKNGKLRTSPPKPKTERH